MFNWDDYLKLAKDLIIPDIQRKSDEACLRTAVSRAYYSAYHKALKYATKKGYSRPKINSHKALIDFLANDNDKEIKAISAKLSIIKKDRVRCDYDDNINIYKINPSKVIKIAEEIISKL
jgi:uncharacterized protein (UPF0332 family)